MRTYVFSFTKNGAMQSLRIRDLLKAQDMPVNLYGFKVYPDLEGEIQAYGSDLKAVVKKVFCPESLLIFVGACGIAVRAIAPFIRDKQSDPAVICIDEIGSFVIPLLSGHMGGANHWAQRIAAEITAQAVITTATDLHGLLAIDQWALEQNMHIGELQVAKKISAMLLAGETVGMDSEFEVAGKIPSGIVLSKSAKTGFRISLDDQTHPYDFTLHLVPRIVYLGIGCRKGVASESVEDLVLDFLEEAHISLKAIAGIASIDLKSKEKGLLDFAAKYELPLSFFTAESLNQVSGSVTPSEFVQEITGVDNVCERAAVLLSDYGKLIMPKKSLNGVAVALAQKSWRVDFEN